MARDADYVARVQKHLASYKTKILGVREPGTWGRPPRPYAHILPRDLYRLNIVEPIRERFWQAHEARRWSLHRYFHHLSSSQALAFNLFFPAYPQFPRTFTATLATLGLMTTSSWHVDFEVVLHPEEGTNLDVLISQPAGPRTIIELKYTEAAFGRARIDSHHLAKLRKTYRPILTGRIAESCLDPKAFFADYQLYRNLAHLRNGMDDRLVLLLPRERRQLWEHAISWSARPELGSMRGQMTVVAVEDLIAALQRDTADHLAGTGYAREVAAKYVLPAA